MKTTLLLLLLLGSIALPKASLAAEQRPNIVVILVADLRWDEAGYAGHPFVETPHIDRIAREGTRFLNAFTTTPLCSPSRASFLTGLYAHTHGILENTERGPLSHRLRTFPQALQSSGFRTAFLGKWHMGNDDSPRPGFDYWLSMKGHGSTSDPELNENGHRETVPGYITDIFTDRAVAFMKEPGPEPFLMYLAHKALNPDLVQYADGSISDPDALIFNPADRHRNLYEGEAITRRPNAKDTLEGKPALQRQIGDLPPLGPGDGPSDEVIRQRLRMLAAVDESTGRLLQTLEEQGTLDDTVVILLSDHGHFCGEHGLGVERRLAYEESARIHFLVRYPRRIKAGATLDSLALNIDLGPTVLDLAGLPPQPDVHGRSLLPLLEGRQHEPWRDSFLIEYFSDKVFPRMTKMGYQAVRTARHKYIRYTELPGMDELYDLEADPYEMTNLVAVPGAASTLEEMQARLAQLLRETGAE